MGKGLALLKARKRVLEEQLSLVEKLIEVGVGCPFCGKWETIDVDKCSQTGRYRILCKVDGYPSGCGASTGWCMTESEAWFCFKSRSSNAE